MVNRSFYRKNMTKPIGCNFDIKLRSVTKAIPSILELRKAILGLSDEDKKFIERIITIHYNISLSDFLETREIPISTLETTNTVECVAAPPDSGEFYTILELAEKIDVSLVKIKQCLASLGYVTFSKDKGGTTRMILTNDGQMIGKQNDKEIIIFHESIIRLLTSFLFITK